MAKDTVSRRRVLQGIAAGVATTGLAGEAAADERSVGHVVKFEPGSSTAAAKRQATSVRHEFDFEHLGKAVAGEFPQAALEGLRKNPHVEYIEEDRVKYHAFAQTLPWGIDRVDADVLHADGETGAGADIAIIDTGIDSDHYDLQANLGEGKAFGDTYCGSAGGGCMFGGSPNDNECHYEWDDDNDHGTHCAGTADAIDDGEGVVGVSTEATLHAAKVLDGCGSGSLSDVAAGIEWTADQGYDVGSMSLGAGSGDQTLQDACQYAYDKGVLLVAAAGNDGPCTDCVGYPAAYDTVVAVSATSEDDSLADFSSTGSEVELAAPGENILSTVPPESSSDGLDTFSGTSMACPHVAGGGGQLMANGYTNTEARQQLQDTAEDIGLASNEQGHGLLDAEAAVLGDGGGSDGFAVSTADATNVGETSATLNGSLDDLDGADSADVWFEWGQAGSDLSNATATQTLSSTGSFDDDVTDLDGGTEYEFRAVAEASDGDTDTGSTLSFTTDSDCVDAANWADGTGTTGYEHLTQVDMDGQVVEASSDDAYYDFTCPEVVTVQQGGSFDIAIDFEDDGYDSHYGNVYVDWAGDGDWSNATETQIFEDVSDDTVTYTATVDVPSDAATGGTLARVRLSWSQFYGPTATDEYGEVNDFTVYVEES